MDIFEKCKTYTKPKAAAAAGYYPYFIPLQSEAGPEVRIEGRSVIMLGSNNYLGLTQHPAVKAAAIRAVERYGTGCTGSRFLNGTLDLHQELEARLARFTRKEATLVFTTGFQTNLGIIAALVGRHDVVILDRADHASLVDGSRLSFGKALRYQHNDMEDLERTLQSVEEHQGALIAVDGVFSMEGDLANLPEIVRLKKKYGARLMVDDAHGIGALGANGRGSAEVFGLEEEVDILMGTFSKSFASTGGFVAADEDVVYYIKHNARPFVFSASIPPASAAAALAALEVIESEPERRERLWQNMRKMKEALDRLGFDTGKSCSPIVPIVIGAEMPTAIFWKKLFQHGVYTNTAVSPAVEPGRELLRTSYMATHTDEHLDRALTVLAKVGKELGLI